jgi:beta-carotene hydroxylase
MSEIAAEYSLQNERAVARRFIGRIQWEMILVGLGQFAIWVATCAMVFAGVVPLWLGFVISTICACLAYLPSHEGQHGNISGLRDGLLWLDSLVGHVSLFILSFPLRFARCTHMKHHAHTNDPEKDFDHSYVRDHWWQAALSVHRDPPREMLEYHMANDQVFAADFVRGLIARRIYSVLMVACALLCPLQTLFLWWLPQKIGLSYLVVFFSHTPHKPGNDTSRYGLARFWRTFGLPRYAVQSMTHHAVHHLYPRIPHWSQPKALAELKPFIEARHMRGADTLAEF